LKIWCYRPFDYIIIIIIEVLLLTKTKIMIFRPFSLLVLDLIFIKMPMRCLKNHLNVFISCSEWFFNIRRTIIYLSYEFDHKILKKFWRWFVIQRDKSFCFSVRENKIRLYDLSMPIRVFIILCFMGSNQCDFVCLIKCAKASSVWFHTSNFILTIRI
jgi:hypothetical protein